MIAGSDPKTGTASIMMTAVTISGVVAEKSVNAVAIFDAKAMARRTVKRRVRIVRV
jgi:hypothetical protein